MSRGFSGGFGGRVGGGPMGAARVGGFQMGGIRTGGLRVARGHVIVNRAFFPHNRIFARRLVRPFFGIGAYAGYSCWRWVPTYTGWSRVWACGYDNSNWSYY